jgi:hypothetical protein
MNFTNEFNSHQGDVEFFSIEEIPTNAKPIEKTFIAKSEKSGHCHALCGDYELFEVEDGHVIKVGSDGCTLNHTGFQNLTPEYWDKNKVMPKADHGHSTIKEGIYFIGIQRRKKHFAKTWEKVMD